MILLASLSASAQKIYTGTISINKNTVKISPDGKMSATETEKAKSYLNKVATTIYGKSYSNIGIDEPYSIVISKASSLDKTPKNARFKPSELDFTTLIATRHMFGIKGYGMVYYVSARKNIAYNSDDDTNIPVKI